MRRILRLAASACAVSALHVSLVPAADNPAAEQQRKFEMRLTEVEKLVLAASQGDYATVDALLARGVDPDGASEKHGATALMNAAAQGHARIVQRLLDAGADKGQVNRFGADARTNAAYYGKEAIAKVLLAKGANPNGSGAPNAVTPLTGAAQSGSLAIVQALLDAGADPNQGGAGELTPLLAAAYGGRTEIARLLIARGASDEAGYARSPDALPVTASRPTRFAPPLDMLQARLRATLEHPDVDKLLARSGEGTMVPVMASAVAPKASREAIAQWTGQPVTVPWTELTLRMIVKHKMSPSRSARGLALLHVAMADALAKSQQGGRTSPLAEHAAVATAAARVLGYLFPSEEHGFERIAAEAIDAGTSALKGSSEHARVARAIGALVGDRIVAYGEADGAAKGWNGLQLAWYGEDRYFGPGAWEPSPPYNYYPPDEPFASGWKTWVLKSPSQFRGKPPTYGSPRHTQALLEVAEIDARRTPEQRALALFWVDGHGSITPPGHWNRIALDLVKKHALDSAQVAALFAALNVTLADSFVACWETKYFYWTIRPINAAGPVLGRQLKPAILTPPFPSYPSGHATFSGASARLLGAWFPEEAGELDTLAEQAALSRLLGGIHYRFDNEDGLTLGRRIADEVLARYR
jgi:hypothetical protein